MADENIIPPVPTATISLDNETNLKNLAGWMARYNDLGLMVNQDVSPCVCQLLNDGILALYQPSLVGMKGCQLAGDEEYELYEFRFCFDDFVEVNSGRDWASLNIDFMSNKCLIYVNICNQSDCDMTSPLNKMFAVIGIEPLADAEPRSITWLEADRIILKYIEYTKNPTVPEVSN